MVPNPREGSEYSCAAARNAPVAICHVILRKPLKCLGTKLHLVSFTNPTKWLSSYDSTPSGVTVACVYFLVSFQNWPLKAPLVGEKKTSLYYYYYWMLHTVSEYLDVIYETCLVKLISLGSDSLTKICMYKKTCVWRVRGDWTCRRRCKYKIMVEEEPTARLYISLLTHLSASLSCLQSTDNKPYASCCRSFSHLPPQLDDLPSSASFPRVWPTSWTLLQPFGFSCHRWAKSLCIVRVLVLSGRWGTAGSLRRQRRQQWRLLARAICSRHSSSSWSSTLSWAHCICGPIQQ